MTAHPGHTQEREDETENQEEQSLEGYKEIAAFELKQMMDSGRKLVIVNVLSEIEYAFQHITGSINIPITKMANTKDLPVDKSIPLIFHCLSDR
ncbi:MAG: rhodanese-like domain-containing protein [Pseudomonadota bacterium]